jgi:hypothetical protein
MNLVWIELERRHCRVSRFDALGQGLAEGLYRIAQMQGSKWRRKDRQFLGGTS